MYKTKAFFDKMRNKNIIFVISFILCAGIISFVAFDTNENDSKSVQANNHNSTSVTATMTWYKAGPDAYELDSEIADFNKILASETSTANIMTSQKVKKEDKTKAHEKAIESVSVSVGKIKAVKKTAALSRTAEAKVKKTASRTVTDATTKKIKKKKKKTAVKTATVTTAVTKAHIPNKSSSGTYETRDISKETYKIKDASTGKKIKSNGFDIVCQIVNGEVGPAWSDEAIKAQAVAAYTVLRYAKENDITLTLGAKSGYDSRIERLVKSVEGLVCTYNGEVINAVFTASTAGCTADSANVWGGSLPYLKSVDSRYDADYDPNYGVVKTLSKSKVKSILEKEGVKLSNNPGRWIKVLSNYNGKYVGNVSIDGKKTLTGARIRSIMGLKSAAFTVKYAGGKFTFTTYGYGHGVGMSQWGAHFYASIGGYKFDQILKHYYKGIKISL